MKTISFTTKDGYTLSGALYRPTESVSELNVPLKGAVLLVCAMGVPQTFYRAFCEWLAERGHFVYR